MLLSFYIFSFLSLFTVYVGKAPHNIASTLLLICAILVIFINKEQAKRVYLEYKLFFVCLLLFFLNYILVNLYHFGFEKEFFLATKAVRWALQSLIIVPAALILVKDCLESRGENLDLLSKRIHKTARVFFFIFSFLFVIIFLTEFLKLHFTYLEPSKLVSQSLYYSRASWLFNPNHFAKLAFFGVLLGVYFFLRFKDLGSKVLALVTVVITLYLTIMSQSRAAWLGVLVSLGFLVLIQIRLRNSKFLTVGLLGLIVFLSSLYFISPVRDRFISSFNTNSFSNRYRLEHWKANVKLIADRPLVGVGTSENRKKSVIDPYLNTEPLKKHTSDEQRIYNGPHNEYLDVGASVGILGLILFLLSLFAPLIAATKSLVRSFNPLAALSVSYMVFMYVALFFDKINFSHWPLLICSWICAFIADDKNNKDLLAHGNQNNE